MPRNDTYEEYLWLRSFGYSDAGIAHELHITLQSLQAAIRRHRRDQRDGEVKSA